MIEHTKARARRSERKTSIYKNGKRDGCLDEGDVFGGRVGLWSVCMYGGKSRTVRLMMRVFVFIIARTKNDCTPSQNASVRRTSNCEFFLVDRKSLTTTRVT